ncbi:MAG: SCO family protein [Acidobacteria bacterium]|nr:SCO family protein [Acidobacteriota bacterium]MCA1618424.1 SCO family protein [Acidobacteriota bacterium]
MKRTLYAIILGLASAAATQTPAQTPKPTPPPDPHAGHGATAKQQQPERKSSVTEKYFSDVELLDQDGRKVRFYTDLLKGKTVVINAFFTTSISVCPAMTANLRKMQDALGERVGKDVFFISISVDPATDTPERLKEYAQKFRAKPGWTFVTGDKKNVDWALYKLGQYVEDKNEHKTVLIIGNEGTGLWMKGLALANASELVKLVEKALNNKGEAK